MSDAQARMRAVIDTVGSVVRGRPQAVTVLAAALFSGGHALVEDVPGSGKTTLARAFARALGGDFSRIQATADLMPADVTGGDIWEPAHGDVPGHFRFIPGPIFANVVLADELNRTSPRTQSAFLEALDEQAVTIDGQRHALPSPFFVVATQNPLEQHGTFPLPEAQLDRFAVAIRLDPMDLATELTVVREQLGAATVDSIEPVVTREELAGLQAHSRAVHVSEAALFYGVSLVTATRRDPRVALGASPRAAISLLRTSQALAVLQGRDHVLPDDIQQLAPSALAHRITLADGPSWATAHSVVADAVASTPVTV